MDVTGAELDSFGQQGIDEFDDRSVLAFLPRNVLIVHFLHQFDVVLDPLHDRGQ